jgi:hypothetical protein
MLCKAMNEAYIYSWCKRRGYFGRTGELSHVLLDKGVLCVPETSQEEFLSEYARGVVQGGKFSCVVEYKPKIFRMFYDLDIVATSALAKMMTDGTFPLNVQEILKLIIGVTADLFDIKKTVVTLCISNTSKKTADGVKVGVHLTFGSIFVSSTVALHVRSKVLEKLAETENPFQNTWEEIVDAAVHKGSGMRLPWAAKPKEPNRVYVPRLNYNLERGVGICEEPLVDATTSFAAVRSILMSVSLRSRGTLTKLIDDISVDNFESPTYSGSIRNSSVIEYATVIKEIEAIIPEEYDGHITGVLKTEHVYMFRHSSKYCANVDRHHHSSNTYFLVSSSGMRQCCYSRKVEFEEKSCPCAQYRGELIKLPRKVALELFPETVPSPPRIVSLPMPTDTTDFTIDRLAAIAAKKPVKSGAKKPKLKKAPSTHSMFLN